MVTFVFVMILILWAIGTAAGQVGEHLGKNEEVKNAAKQGFINFMSRWMK